MTYEQNVKSEPEKWEAIRTSHEGIIVMTKVDDDKGVRNEQALRREGLLWFVPDGSMYVYYEPTHWRPLTVQEADVVTATLRKRAQSLRTDADQVERRVLGVSPSPVRAARGVA